MLYSQLLPSHSRGHTWKGRIADVQRVCNSPYPVEVRLSDSESSVVEKEWQDSTDNCTDAILRLKANEAQVPHGSFGYIRRVHGIPGTVMKVTPLGDAADLTEARIHAVLSAISNGGTIPPCIPQFLSSYIGMAPHDKANAAGTSSPALILLMEDLRARGGNTLDTFYLTSDHPSSRSFMAQLLMTLSILNERYGFVHGDLYAQNVWVAPAAPFIQIRIVEKLVGDVDARETLYRLCTVGRQPILLDFARSSLTIRTPSGDTRTLFHPEYRRITQTGYTGMDDRLQTDLSFFGCWPPTSGKWGVDGPHFKGMAWFWKMLSEFPAWKELEGERAEDLATSQHATFRFASYDFPYGTLLEYILQQLPEASIQQKVDPSIPVYTVEIPVSEFNPDELGWPDMGPETLSYFQRIAPFVSDPMKLVWQRRLERLSPLFDTSQTRIMLPKFYPTREGLEATWKDAGQPLSSPIAATDGSRQYTIFPDGHVTLHT